MSAEYVKVTVKAPPKDKKIVALWKKENKTAIVHYDPKGVWYTDTGGFAGNAEYPAFDQYIVLPVKGRR